MKSTKALLIGMAIAGATALAKPSFAQSPLFVHPDQNGGFILAPPGQLPTNIRPDLNGGFIVSRPGQLPTNIFSDHNGGFIINQPPVNQPNPFNQNEDEEETE